jgi:hypothetical protein
MKHILIAIALVYSQSAFTQSIIGFWGINEVTVGDKVMTPVAKWTRINGDGTFQSGNGWLQNSEGHWTLDQQTRLYRPVETNGIIDQFGAFKISFQNDAMTWEREEEGEKVVVRLQRIEELPKATADILVGLWSLKKISLNGNSIKDTFDPDNNHYVFIRWDRIYVERTPQGERATGFWHINGHRPEVTFIGQGSKISTEVWRVEVDNAELRMTGISDSNKGMEKTYGRINKFPE